MGVNFRISDILPAGLGLHVHSLGIRVVYRGGAWGSGVPGWYGVQGRCGPWWSPVVWVRGGPGSGFWQCFALFGLVWQCSGPVWPSLAVFWPYLAVFWPYLAVFGPIWQWLAVPGPLGWLYRDHCGVWLESLVVSGWSPWWCRPWA